MNILYFIDHLRPDGTQRVLKQLVEGLAARGHKQTIVCLNASWDGELVTSLRKTQANVRIVGKLPLISGYGFLSLWHWLRQERFDVAVTLLFVADLIGRTLARAARIPRIISSLRSRNINYPSWKRWLARQTMVWADAVIINSTATRYFAIVEEGAPANQIYLIPNGVSVEDYRHPMCRAALRAEFGLEADRCLVGSVGRLMHQKGFDVLLHALSFLPHTNINLLLMGVGEQEANLRAQVAMLSLQDRVHFAGYRRDVPHLLGALDLYIHPARFEGMPNALLEAMAAACPIIASRTDGNRDLIESGVHGWLVPPEDPKALAEAIQAVLSNPTEAQHCAANAQRHVAAHFGVEPMVMAWERVLMDRS